MPFLSVVFTLHDKLLRNWRKVEWTECRVWTSLGRGMRWNVTVEGHLDDTLVDAEDKVVRVL